jgi:hypothetical protein
VSDFDAYEEDVGRLSSLSDHEIDRVLTGRALGADGALEEIAAFLEDVRPYFQEPPNDVTAAQHLAAIGQATRALSDGTGVAVHGFSADRARSQRARSRSRSTLGRRKLLVLAAALGVLLAFGGAAYAGALPGPVQGAVSDLVGNVGVSVPGDGDGDSDDGGQGGSDDGPVGDHEDRDLGDVDRGEQPVDEGPPNDVGDDQRGDVDDDQQGEGNDGAGDNADDGDGNDDDQGEQEDVDEGHGGGQEDAGEDDDDQGEDNGNRGHGDDDDGESGQGKDETSSKPRSSGRSESAPQVAAELQACLPGGATARPSRGGPPRCR